MNQVEKISLGSYNGFCKSLVEGNILYNLDSTNLWGEYLLVANISTVNTEKEKTYAVLLLGLKKEKDSLLPTGTCIKLTPDYSNNIPFLKPVGYCKFQLVPNITTLNLNVGMAAIYGSIDLWKYRRKLDIHKPRKSKYDKDGKLVIKNAGNN